MAPPPVCHALVLPFQVSLPGSPGAGTVNFRHISLPQSRTPWPFDLMSAHVKPPIATHFAYPLEPAKGLGASCGWRRREVANVHYTAPLGGAPITESSALANSLQIPCSRKKIPC